MEKVNSTKLVLVVFDLPQGDLDYNPSVEMRNVLETESYLCTKLTSQSYILEVPIGFTHRHIQENLSPAFAECIILSVDIVKPIEGDFQHLQAKIDKINAKFFGK